MMHRTCVSRLLAHSNVQMYVIKYCVNNMNFVTLYPYSNFEGGPPLTKLFGSIGAQNNRLIEIVLSNTTII